MIRTHKPRGYAWTCASLFQQTPDFRNISYANCQIDDQTEDFGPSERIVKRQRVEKLADDFLNGRALYISSARLPSRGLQHAVARSFARPKDARRAMAEVETSESVEMEWECVQDQWEILREYNHSEGDDEQAMSTEVSALDDEEIVVEVHAQASCTSARRQRTIKLAIGPSDEALQQAAALRNRTLLRRSGRLSISSVQRAQSEAIIEETQEDSSRSSLQTTASDVGPTPTAAWTSSKWLTSGTLELRHKAVDEECSKDELGLSSLPTPSQKAAARPRRGRSATSQRDRGTTSVVSSVIDGTLSSTGNDYRSSDSTQRGSDSCEGTVYVLVPSPEDLRQENEELQGDSQAQLLRRQGIRAAPRKSWTSFGGTAKSAAGAVVSSISPPVEEPALSPTMRVLIQESASSNVGRTLKSKRTTKSTGAAHPAAPVPSRRLSSRSKSAPSESQAAAEQTTGVSVDQQRRMDSFRAGENTYMSVPGTDTSPFLFRKRVSKSNNSDDPDIETSVVEPEQRQPQTKTPKRVEFVSDSPQLARTKPTSTLTDPTTPLVNEYLNRLLPKTGGTGSCTTSVRKALRDEMRLAGAQFSRVEGEPPSPQARSVTSNGERICTENGTFEEDELATEAASEMPPPQIWPGTQVLLAEAQKDLFTSPNKENTTLYLGDKTTPQTRDVPRRRPLQPLSQEHLPMPSTQALLDGWQGWSSIKKPRSAAGKRSSILPSPSIKKGSNIHLIDSDPDPTHSFDEVGIRRSSLRYSMSCNDSPDQQQTESLPIAAFFPAQRSTRDHSTSSKSFESSNAGERARKVQQEPHRASDGIASSATFFNGRPLSTNGSTVVSSLPLHVGLSLVDQSNTTTQQQQEQESSISFSLITRSEPQRKEPRSPAIKPPRAGLSTRLTEQGSLSFSPLAQPSNVEQGEDTTIEYGTPAAPLPRSQQAQNDASGRFLQTVDMDSQELDFTVTDLVVDILGSARRDMPKGTGVFSQ